MAKAVLIRDFPDDLHKRARLRAVTEGTSLKGIILKAVAEYLERTEKKVSKKGGDR
jgi:plasmid stability protein